MVRLRGCDRRGTGAGEALVGRMEVTFDRKPMPQEGQADGRPSGAR